MAVDIFKYILSFSAGILIGLFYFGGLWWTLRRMPVAQGALVWMVASFLIRASLALAGFYLASGGDWIRLLVCLLGFILVRTVMVKPEKEPVISNQ